MSISKASRKRLQKKLRNSKKRRSNSRFKLSVSKASRKILLQKLRNIDGRSGSVDRQKEVSLEGVDVVDETAELLYRYIIS